MRRNPAYTQPFPERIHVRPWALLRRSCKIFLVTVLILSSPIWATPTHQASYAATPQAREYELKAVYLYNFLQFVNWPEKHEALPKDGVKVIGILGDSPFGESLEALQASIRNKGMSSVRIIHFGNYREGLNLNNCHLLFVCSSEKRNLSRITAGLKGMPVLTVADTEDFLSSGGMIALVNRDGKIRWMIDRRTIDKAGLRISAQILKMAIKVLE